MNPELQTQLDELRTKVSNLENTVEEKSKTRRVWIWIAVAAVVFPLIGLAFAIPHFLSIYTNLP